MVRPPNPEEEKLSPLDPSATSTLTKESQSLPVSTTLPLSTTHLAGQRDPLLPTLAELATPRQSDTLTAVSHVPTEPSTELSTEPTEPKPTIVVVEHGDGQTLDVVVDGGPSVGQASSTVVVEPSEEEPVSYVFAGSSSRDGQAPNLVAASPSEFHVSSFVAESTNGQDHTVTIGGPATVVAESTDKRVPDKVVELSEGQPSIDERGDGQAPNVTADSREGEEAPVVISDLIEGQDRTLIAESRDDGQQLEALVDISQPAEGDISPLVTMRLRDEQAPNVTSYGLHEGQAQVIAADNIRDSEASVFAAENREEQGKTIAVETRDGQFPNSAVVLGERQAEIVARGVQDGQTPVIAAENNKGPADIVAAVSTQGQNSIATRPIEEQASLLVVGEGQAPISAAGSTNVQVPAVVSGLGEAQLPMVATETKETEAPIVVIEPRQIPKTVAAIRRRQTSKMVGGRIQDPHVVVDGRQLQNFVAGRRGRTAPNAAAGTRESQAHSALLEAGGTQAPSILAGPGEEEQAQNNVSGIQAPYDVVVQGLGKQASNIAAGPREGQATNVVAGTRVVVEAKGFGELQPSEAKKLPLTKRRKITVRGQWTNDTLEEAISAVRSGAMTLRQAGRHYNIPPSSLSDHMTGRITKRKYGPQGVLSQEEEASVVEWVRETLADGWPVGIKQLKMKVAEVTKGRPTPFTKGIPGSSWLRLFKNRHPDLRIGMPEERLRRKSSARSSFPSLPPLHTSADVDGFRDADASAPSPLPLVVHPEDSQTASDAQPEGTDLSIISQPTDSQPSATTHPQVPRRKRSIERGQWTSDALEKAIVAVNGGYMSMRRAARIHNIPPSSLSDHMKGKVGKRKPGLQETLSAEEEDSIVQWALKMQEEGEALTIQQLKLKVAEMTKARGTTAFASHVPGAAWWKLFRARHPELAIERTERASIQNPLVSLLPAPEAPPEDDEQPAGSQLPTPSSQNVAQLRDSQPLDVVAEAGDMQPPDVALVIESQPSVTPKLRVSKRRKMTGSGQRMSDSLEEAIGVVRSGGMSLDQAAEFYNIPASSLLDHMTGRITKRKYGPQEVLSEEEEASVVEWVLKMREDGQSVSIQQLKSKLAEVTQSRPTPFTGDSWWNLFIHRHPDLSIGVTEGMSNPDLSSSSLPNEMDTPLDGPQPLDSQFPDDENPTYFQQSIEYSTFPQPSEPCSSPSGFQLTTFQPAAVTKSQQPKRKRTAERGQWTNDALAQAIAAVKQGAMNMRQAARFHNIPPSSLSDHLKGKITKRKYGPQGVLSQEEENIVVEWLLKKQEEGESVSIRQLKLKVAEITQTRQTPFTKGIPGPTWWKLFKARHPDLSICSSEGRSNPKPYICITPPLPASPSHSAEHASGSQLLDLQHATDSHPFQPSPVNVSEPAVSHLSAPSSPNFFQLTDPQTSNDEQPMDVEPFVPTNGQVAKRKGMTKTGQWTSDSLAKAITAVKRGNMGLRQAARAYNIPPSSLYDHLTGKIKKRKRGPQGVLSQEEEALVVEWILKTQEEGRSVTIQQLKLKVAEITRTRQTPFTKGIPGPTWWKLFKARHPDLVIVPEVRVYKS